VLYKEYFKKYLRIFFILQFISLFFFLSGNFTPYIFPFLKEMFHHENMRRNVLKFMPFILKFVNEHNLPAATLSIFSINLLMGAFLLITLPSFVIPFWGIFSGLSRFFIWGIIFSFYIKDFSFLKYHYVTLFLEGEGYIMAMFPVCVMWIEFFRGREKREVYFSGIKFNLFSYIFIILLLLLAAFYEAIEGIYLLNLN